MRVTYIALSRCLFILLLLLFGACSKIIDWKDVWDNQKPNCRIEKIISYSSWTPTRTGIFTYNEKGDPVTVTFDYTSTGASNFLFLYDNKNRLKGYLATYPNNGPETWISGYQFWFSYTYDAKGRIISDTSYQFGNIEYGVPKVNPYNTRYYANYEYDAVGRVIKVVRYLASASGGEGTYASTAEYIYNSDGNLSISRLSTPYWVTEAKGDSYDNKINFHQTNKVWMFVDRNYSKNNTVSAVQYNSKGLPLKFDINPSVYFDFLWQIELRRADIFYSCGK